MADLRDVLKEGWAWLPDDVRRRRLAKLGVDAEAMEKWQRCCGIESWGCSCNPVDDDKLYELVKPEECVDVVVRKYATFSGDWRFTAKITLFVGDVNIQTEELETEDEFTLEAQIQDCVNALSERGNEIMQKAFELHKKGYRVQFVEPDC